MTGQNGAGVRVGGRFANAAGGLQNVHPLPLRPARLQVHASSLCSACLIPLHFPVKRKVLMWREMHYMPPWAILLPSAVTHEFT